jgi:eukaryotic-like serine/threonine-protein kinase
LRRFVNSSHGLRPNSPRYILDLLGDRLNLARFFTFPLSAGDKLGPYEILASIGAGGMGEGYRVQDSRLNRDVAIRVSGAQFSERFESEAKAIAALNHPNICQIYDVGPNYLVMEYVEGLPIC